MFLMPLLLRSISFGIIQYCSDEIKIDVLSPVNAKTSYRGRSNALSFVPSLSFRDAKIKRYSRQHLSPSFLARKEHVVSGEDEDSNTQFSPSFKNNTVTETTDIDISSINEAQVLLACRAYLLRKHKVDWKEKKRRAQAEASLSNSGYFWPDPNELRYSRLHPEHLHYEGYKKNGVRFLMSQDLAVKSVQPENERASTSSNPFSTNPLYPSDEHVRRSKSKLKLWNNQTWVDGWYNKRWAGKVATQSQKNREKQDRLLRQIPNDVLESPSFDAMTEDEVVRAIHIYLTAHQRKSESRKGKKIRETDKAGVF